MKIHYPLYGYCPNCEEPLGWIGGDIFCYKCSDFKKLEKIKAISQYKDKLDKIRISFRNGIDNGHINRYFYNYLTYGEAIFGTEEKEYLTLSSERIKTVGFINFKKFVIGTLGIKWILEDLNFISKTSENYQDTIFSLPQEWIIYFQRLIYLENDLGNIIIDSNNNEKFYYHEKLKFYLNSLNQFGLLNPNEIKHEKYNEIKQEILEKEIDSKYVEEFAKIHLPLYFVCITYAQYPNMNDRIFSFEDILYNPIVIDYLGYIIDEYKDKRARSPEEWSKENPYFLSIDFNQLKSDIPKIFWNNTLASHIIASQYNPMSFPLLIEYQSKIIITPTRLKIAREMMFEKLLHNLISAYLSIVYENEFQQKILDKLEENNCIVKDPVNNDYWIYISDKKNATFEFDIMAVYNNYILAIECKSFHPTAFYHLTDAINRREVRVKHYNKQFKEIIQTWFIKNLKNKSKSGYISINCRSKEIGAKKTKKYTLNLEDRFKSIEDKQIIGLFVTQYKEYFKGYPEIFQIHYEDLEDFLNNLN